MSTGTIGGTLIGGIQDIAALLPLLGTEQCEDHIGSAHTRGYLYAAATPMSIFGSLGMVRAGFKALVASCDIPCWGFVGARKLADMGFKPQGENLALIMFDDNQENYSLNARLEDILHGFEEPGIDDVTKVEVVHQCAKWNVTMMLVTGIASFLSVAPYIHLNTTNITGESSLNNATRWTFPALRALGGLLTATMTQLVIQRRIVTLVHKYFAHKYPALRLASEPRDVEEGQSSKGVPIGDKLDTNSVFTGLIFFLLIIGIIASIVGYVGCFSVVQNTRTKTGPISWLFQEVGLSIIRTILWGINPTFDDPPPLELKLTLGGTEGKKMLLMGWDGVTVRYWKKVGN